jgi:hypothetical protein
MSVTLSPHTSRSDATREAVLQYVRASFHIRLRDLFPIAMRVLVAAARAAHLDDVWRVVWAGVCACIPHRHVLVTCVCRN